MSVGNICPICKLEMKVLIFSYYCPNECDRRSTPKVAIDGIMIIGYGGDKWKMIRVNKGTEMPNWVSRGWALINDTSDGRGDPSKSLSELSAIWEYKLIKDVFLIPGWSVTIIGMMEKYGNVPMLGFSRT